MEDYAKSIKENFRKFSPSELRAKEVYIKKEIKTSNPNRFFRNIAIGMGEMGYAIDKGIENKIKRGEFGESSFVSVPIAGLKTVTEKRGRKSQLIAGAVVTGVGVLLIVILPPLGILVLGAGELWFILWLQGRSRDQNKEKKPAERTSRIWLMLESKMQAAQPGEPESAVSANHRSKVSEFIVHAAGESGGDKALLKAEVKKLTDRLEFFV